MAWSWKLVLSLVGARRRAICDRQPFAVERHLQCGRLGELHQLLEAASAPDPAAGTNASRRGHHSVHGRLRCRVSEKTCGGYPPQGNPPTQALLACEQP